MEDELAEQERFREGLEASYQDSAEVMAIQEEAPQSFRSGDTVTFSSGDSVTLYSYTSPVQASDRIWKPKAGKQFAAIDVEGCAGRHSEDGQAALNPFFFSLQMPDNTRIGPTISVVDPALGHTNLGPGECVRGFVSFQVPQGQGPSYVRLGMPMRFSIRGPQETAKWAIN